MPSRCVVYGCSNLPDPEKGISLHKIPFYNDSRPEAIKRRKVWVDFVKSKRAKWEPGREAIYALSILKRTLLTEY